MRLSDRAPGTGDAPDHAAAVYSSAREILKSELKIAERLSAACAEDRRLFLSSKQKMRVRAGQEKCGVRLNDRNKA
jgi:hypothetical protein